MKQEITTTTKRSSLSRSQKFFLSLPLPLSNMSGVLIHNVYIKFYTDIIGLSPKYVGTIYLIYNIWNFLNDPVFGILIDRMPYNPQKGKYVYLMRVSVPFMVFCLAAMVWSSPSWPQLVIFTVLLIELFIFDTFSTVYLISINSFTLLAAPTKEERIDINVIQSYVANIISFFATLIPSFLLVGNEDSNRIQICLIIMAVVALNAGLYFFAIRKLEDKKEYYTVGILEGSINLNTVRAEIIDLFRMPSFRTWAMFNFFAMAPASIYFTAFLYMMDHVIRSDGLQATVADTAPMIIVLLLLPLAGKYIKKHGGKHSVFIGALPYVLGYVLLFFSKTWWMVLISYIPIMGGRYMISTACAPLSAALIDENEKLTGTRRPGLISAVLTLLTAPSMSAQLAIYMWILDFFGYDADLKIQTARAMMGIRIGTCIVPIVFIIIGMIPFIFFPINKQKEEELSNFSAQRRHSEVFDSEAEMTAES